MNTRMNKQAWCGLGLLLALAAVSPSQAAGNSHGLRVVSSQAHVSGGATLVEARISRTLANRPLSAQRLRVAILAADGSVRAEQQRLVGPAQLARGNARDRYLSIPLNAVAGANDRLVVEWLDGAL